MVSSIHQRYARSRCARTDAVGCIIPSDYAARAWTGQVVCTTVWGPELRGIAISCMGQVFILVRLTSHIRGQRMTRRKVM
jgi:hypothetical protein